jgi:hypothetical protein
MEAPWIKKSQRLGRWRKPLQGREKYEFSVGRDFAGGWASYNYLLS